MSNLGEGLQTLNSIVAMLINVDAVLLHEEDINLGEFCMFDPVQ